MTTLVAGVDSSTQSCKVVVRRLDDGAVVRAGSARHPDGTEVDPERWWAALQEAISAAGGLDDVAAISIGGQQHGMVALDDGGRVIRPALLWNDTRSAPAARALVEEIGAAELSERTGSVPVASFTSTKLRWLRDAEPDNAARVAAVALPHDWLTWRLRGFGVDDPQLDRLTTDRSDASGTGYWNPSTDSYDLDLLEHSLGHTARLPDVLLADATSGRLPGRQTVVGAGAGDNAAAALGLGAEAGDVVISIGTSGTVFAVSDRLVSDRTGTVAGFADASGRFLPLIATLNAARVLDTVAELLDTDHRTLGELAMAAEPGSGGMVLTPYFAGERTPNLPDATASIRGMSLANTTRPNLARASIEGMLSGLADGLDAITRLGVAADRIILIGGAAQNAAVQRIAAQVFAQPVTVPEPGEYVAAGAARQAAWALTGRLPAWSIAPASTHEVDHRPGILAAYRSYGA